MCRNTRRRGSCRLHILQPFDVTLRNHRNIIICYGGERKENLKRLLTEALVLFMLALMTALLYNAVSPRKIKLFLPKKIEKKVHVTGNQEGEKTK